jgi:hypothetical protein
MPPGKEHMTVTELQPLRDQLLQLQRLVEQMAELQVRQIDRERNVPGTDPAELLTINSDLAVARGIARKLADLRNTTGDSPATRA